MCVWCTTALLRAAARDGAWCCAFRPVSKVGHLMSSVVATYVNTFPDQPPGFRCIVASPLDRPYAAHFRAFGFGPQQQACSVKQMAQMDALVEAHTQAIRQHTVTSVTLCTTLPAPEHMLAADAAGAPPGASGGTKPEGSAAATPALPLTPDRATLENRAAILFDKMVLVGRRLTFLGDVFPSYADADATKDVHELGGGARCIPFPANPRPRPLIHLHMHL